MADRRPSPAGWLRGLFGGRPAEPPRFPGREALAAAGHAVWTVAGRSAQIVHAVEVPFGPATLPPTGSSDVGRAPARIRRETDARAAVAGAVGAAIAGSRAAAFVPADDLPNLVPTLRSAMRRRVPLAVVAAYEPRDRQGHDAAHVAAAAGVPTFVAPGPQAAVDLFVLAVRIAETVLSPVVVVLDGPATAWGPASIRLPESELLRDWLGAAADAIDCPSPSQRSLFGERRRRVPAWFDPDRPALTGATLTGPAADAAAAAERLVVEVERDAAVAELARAYEALVGRPVASIEPPARPARVAVVALGDDVGVARAAVAVSGSRAGGDVVIAVPSLTPFPAAALRAALRDCETVVVLDRCERGTPLRDRLRSALEQTRPVSWTWSRPDAAAIAAALSREGATDLHLGAVAPSAADSRLPKRRIAIERLRRDHPDLEGRLLAGDEDLDLRPEGAKTVLIATRDAAWPRALGEEAAAALAAVAGPEVVSRVVRGGHGHWMLRVTAARAAFADPGEAAPADVVVAIDPEPRAVPRVPAGTPLVARLREDGSPDLPPDWLRAAREGAFRVFGRIDPEARVETVLRAVLDGTFEGLAEVEVSASAPPRDAAGELPAVVRRFERSEDDWAGLPRFWSEQMEPALAGDARRPVPDPRTALAAVPPYTATLDDRSGDRERTPSIDPAACTGCGRCWTTCPEAAILPVAFASQTLVDTFAERAASRLEDPAHPGLGKLRRAGRQVAARLDARIVKESLRRVGPDDLRAAYHDVLEKLGLDEDDRVVADRLVDEVCAEIDGLPVAAPQATFADAHAASKGDGRLLLLAVDPAACNGCGICAYECADDAITRPEGPGDVASMRRAVRAWETLPDTDGETVKRIAARDDVGPMAAVLLSRHAACGVFGGGDSPPGSGARMAARLVTAAAEASRQPAVTTALRELDDLHERLRAAVREEMSRVLDVADLDTLDRAIDGVASRPGNVGEIVERLREAGEAPHVDTVRARRLFEAARGIETLRRRLAEGADGQGRARYALVVGGRRAASWAAAFPYNPFGVPVTVDDDDDGADVAAGIARTLVAARVAEARIVRSARLALEAPPDLPARERRLATLDWSALDDGERALVPRIVLLLDGDAARGPARAGLPRLLASGLPVTCLVLDDGDPLSTEPDPTLLALAHREAYVVACSPSHADLLFRGAAAALAFDGPSYVHVLAPEPSVHGFPTEATVERARRAVRSRVFPLLRYDPAAEGVFGLRLDLAGNPAPDAVLVAADGEAPEPASWAAAERRYASFLHAADDDGVPIATWLTESPDARGAHQPTVPGPNGERLGVGETLRAAAVARLAHWRTLQELAGIETPFTDRVRERVAAETESAHRESLDALRRDYDAKLDGERRALEAEQVERLRDRLLQLAGYDPARLPRPDGEEGDA